MNFTTTLKSVAAATALVLATGSANAATVDLDQQVSGNTFGVPNWSEVITRSIDANPNGNRSGTYRLYAGLFRLKDGSGTPVEAFCLEPGISLDLGPDFHKNVATAMTSDQLASVQKLYDSSYHSVVNAATAAGFQLALWEIAAETDKDISGELIYNLSVGNHKILSASAAALDAGSQFLANLSGTYSQKYRLTTYTNSGQDLVSATPVPLPASALLLLAGVGGLAAMRRRKSADA